MPSRRARSGNYAVYRNFSNKLAEEALLPVYLARRRRKVDAADADADQDNEEGEVLEANAESKKAEKDRRCGSRDERSRGCKDGI
jgi:hypothetical protein